MNDKYHKIETVFKRDPGTKFKTLLFGEYASPELKFLADNEWRFTEKVDGTNIRVMFDGQAITFGGKTDNAQIPQHLVNALNSQFLPMLEAFKSVFDDSHEVCLYGEGYGAKIQKGGSNYRHDQGFVLFDVRVDDWCLQWADVLDVSENLGLETVPAVGFGTLPEMVKRVEEGFTSHWGDFAAEGIVARPTTELCTRTGKRIITKIKHKDFVQDKTASPMPSRLTPN